MSQEQETGLPTQANVLDLLKQEQIQETTPEQKETVQETEIEQQARAAGWKPKDEFSGDGWVDAGEFVRRGQLFDKISHQSRELREMKKAIQQLAEHNAKIETATRERTIAELKAAKKLAMDDGNTSAIVELDERLAEARAEMKEIKSQTAQEKVNEVPQEYFDFATANPWYTKDRAMTAFADALGQDLFQRGLSPAQVYNEVAKEVKKEFAHKFQRQSGSAQVETSSQGGKATETASKFTPSAAEREFAKQMVSYGIFKSESDYYAQLKKIKN